MVPVCPIMESKQCYEKINSNTLARIYGLRMEHCSFSWSLVVYISRGRSGKNNEFM